MSLFLTPQTENNNDLVYSVSGSKLKRNKNRNTYSHEGIDAGLQLLKKVYSASQNFSNVIAKDRPAFKIYIHERQLVQELYIKIQKELKVLCKDNISLTSKFLMDQPIPENYFRWSVHIKETIMALLLHEEIYQNMDSIGVTEEILDDLLVRLKDLDDLKYKAIEEEQLVQSLSEDEAKHLEELKSHYSDLRHYLDIFEEDYNLNRNEELGEAI